MSNSLTSSHGNWMIPSSLSFKQFQEWKKHKAQPEPSLKLPHNFAQELLHHELEIESDTFTMQTVIELLQLYRLGVEYYESIKDDKYLIFKNKS